MAIFKKSLETFKEEINNMVKYYLQLPEKDPFTDPYLISIKDYANELINDTEKHNELLDTQMNNLDLIYTKLFNEYNKEKNEFDQTLKNTQEIVAEKYDKEIKEQKNNISILKRNNKYNEGNIKQDIYFFQTSSAQKKSLLEQEYIENKNRFDYQKKAANETYEENIRKRDMILDNDLLSVRNNYATNLTQFDEDCSSILTKLDKKIYKLNSELAELEAKEQAIENKHKALARQESIEFNALIKTLQDDKNKDIVSAKDKYSKSLNDDNIEKEQSHKQINDDIQRAMKEFVSKINKLDERLNKTRMEYQTSYKILKQDYFYELIRINRKEQYETQNILNQEINVKRDLKTLKKKYLVLHQVTKEKSNQALVSLEIDYHHDLENIRHERILTELNKNQAIKRLSEMEQSNNKHYQEQGNIYENRMNLEIFMANSRYNKEANKFKCESRKRNIALEKDYNDSLLKLRKDIKTVITKLKEVEININCVTELNKLLHNEESQTFKKHMNYLSVNCLLEIERHKSLKIYNDKQYEYNITNAQTVLDYSMEKLSIQNNEYETLNHATLEINKQKMNREITEINHQIIQLGIEELEEKSIQARNIQYKLDSLMHNTIKERYKHEIIIINQTLSTMIINLKQTQKLISFTIEHLYLDLKIRQEYIPYIQMFIDDLMTKIDNFYTNMYHDFYEAENEIINSRLYFEESFKFKENYEHIENEYHNDSKILTDKKDLANETITNAKRSIDIASSRISSMYNQIEHVKNSNKSYETKQKEIHQLRLRISVLKNEISSSQLKITALNQDIEVYVKDLKELEQRYFKQDNELKELQFNSAKSFHNLRNELQKQLHYSKQRLYQTIHISPDKYSYNTIKNLTYQLTDHVEHVNYETFSTLYNIVNTFAAETVEAIGKDKRLLLQKYRNDLGVINSDISKKINSNNDDCRKALEKIDDTIHGLEKDYQFQKQSFINQLNICERNFNDKSHEIIRAKDSSAQKFYQSYYAVDDNSKGIDSNYTSFVDSKRNEFLSKKNDLINTEVQSRNNLNNELNQYILSNDEAINHLPEATKLQKMEIDGDTKAKNKDIDLTIYESRENYNSNKKNINKNIEEIRSTLDYSLTEIDYNYQQDLKNENKTYAFNLKRISRGIIERK